LYNCCAESIDLKLNPPAIEGLYYPTEEIGTTPIQEQKLATLHVGILAKRK
jgi:hypothetical protein